MSKKKPITTPQTKPPVVTIMGHVDHGKTTLLDYIRKSNITTKEAGGITQAIGAYQIQRGDQKITFIDTPGHAAFSKMRSRGASVTDIVILVVAADDGVMPQTKESIRHIKSAAAPLIVAINKVDLKNAVPEMVKAQLVEEGINVEGYGGDTPFVEISARDGKGVDKLLDTIQALAELQEITADPNGPLKASVIESSLKKNVGPVATLLVQQGTLKIGQEITSVSKDPITGKIKRLLTDSGKAINQALPATPVEVLGLKQVPAAGSLFTTSKDLPTVQKELKELEELEIATNPNQPETDLKPEENQPAPNDEQESPEEDQEQEERPNIQIILNADTKGSLEAIQQNLPEEVTILQANTGQVTESDVMLAQTTSSVIIAFNVPIDRSAKKLAEVERVPLKPYKIIYKLLEDFESQILKLLEPTIDEQELGRAKVKALFDIKDSLIAGCIVTSGKMSLGDKVHLRRDDKIITDATISSLKQGKVDAKEITQDQECGIVLKPRLNIQENDIIQAFTKVQEQ